MVDLVDRIFEHVSDHGSATCEICMLLKEASASLTEAKAKIERLREALKPFAKAATGIDPTDNDGWLMWEYPQANEVKVGDFRRAARALGEKE